MKGPENGVDSLQVVRMLLQEDQVGFDTLQVLLGLRQKS